MSEDKVDTQLKILARLESMEDNQTDIHNIIDSIWSELINIHDTIKLYTNISKLEESKCKQREEEAFHKGMQEEAFNRGIKDGSVKPLAVCILPDNYDVTGKDGFDLLKSQFPHLCNSLHTGTWTIIYNTIPKTAIYYHLPAYKNEALQKQHPKAPVVVRRTKK
jgi:hypothetical protein